ncbi:MAG: hypothetical protein QM599_10525 [Pseudoxanthomonas sp.]
MSGEYDRLRQLLLDTERGRLDALQDDMGRIGERLSDQMAGEIETSLADGQPTRLTRALAESTINGLEQAVQRKPQTVVDAVFPVIGPAIRRSIQEAMRQLAGDIDSAVNNALSPRALKWRIEAWRSGVPYAQVALRHSAHWRVEHLFWIQPDSGLLLGHRAAPDLSELDADAIAGMFTAIQSFVRDSVQGGDGGIGAATVGDYQLVVAEGPQARLVAFVRGLPPGDFSTRLQALNETLHARHGAALAAGGDLGVEPLEPSQLDALNAHGDAATAPPPQSKAARYLRWGVLAMLLALLAWWAWASWQWSRQVADVRQHLSAMPGLVVTQLDDGKRGRLHIEGLRDPLAADPQAWLAQQYPKIAADWRLRGFYSMEPALVAARAARALGLPAANVAAPDAQGVLKLHGEAPYADWLRLRENPPTLAMPGVSRLDASALSYPQQARIEARVEQLAAMIVPFASGATAPDADWEKVVPRIAATVRELQQAGGDEVAFRFSAYGLTDGGGGNALNADLRRQRGQWLAAQLADAVHAPSRLVVAAPASVPGENGPRGARVTAQPVSAKAATQPKAAAP